MIFSIICTMAKRNKRSLNEMTLNEASNTLPTLVGVESTTYTLVTHPLPASCHRVTIIIS